MASVFDDVDAKQLEAIGFITKIVRGNRTVLASLINPFLQVLAGHPIPTTNLPAYIESEEAYQFLGFRPATSWNLFQYFMAPGSSKDEVHDFFELALQQINGFRFFEMRDDLDDSLERAAMLMDEAGIEPSVKLHTENYLVAIYLEGNTLHSAIAGQFRMRMDMLKRAQERSRQRSGRVLLTQVLGPLPPWLIEELSAPPSDDSPSSDDDRQSIDTCQGTDALESNDARQSDDAHGSDDTPPSDDTPRRYNTRSSNRAAQNDNAPQDKNTRRGKNAGMPDSHRKTKLARRAME